MSSEKGPNSVQGSTPRGWGLTQIFWIMEHPYQTIGLLFVPSVCIAFGRYVPLTKPVITALILGPILIIPVMVLIWYFWYQGEPNSPASPELKKKMLDMKKHPLSRYGPTAKVPMETWFEAYIREEVDIKEDLYEVLLHRNELFRFCFTSGHVKGLMQDVVSKALGHDHAADIEDVAGVYNRGNDFYGWFLGEPMLYSTAIFRNREESLDDAQDRKLNTICQMAHMREGMSHLDLGCGWGTLIAHAAGKFKVKSRGITLSKEQAAFARNRVKNYAKKYGTCDAKVDVINCWDLNKDGTEVYDRITCLEMSEHIGIRYYAKFMQHVRKMLKDDGIFYLQIAGLRRSWQYEDLLWGLFMGKYIFPGADASCPLGWVCQQVERAGFEVHRVENTGVHYALTIKAWYYNWVDNKAKVVAKYGERWWRLWAIFLAWSAIIAFQGTSTVFMLTLMKNTKNDKTSIKQSKECRDVAPALDRTAYKVGDDRKFKADDRKPEKFVQVGLPVATQC